MKRIRTGFGLVFSIGCAATGLLAVASFSFGQTPGFDDHQNMMDQLGLKALRPGPNPNDQSTFDEANANPYRDSMPAVLKMNDGTPVTTAAQWPARRSEIVELFEREVYGR